MFHSHTRPTGFTRALVRNMHEFIYVVVVVVVVVVVILWVFLLLFLLSIVVTARIGTVTRMHYLYSRLSQCSKSMNLHSYLTNQSIDKSTNF
jgi:hypothetical protein